MSPGVVGNMIIGSEEFAQPGMGFHAHVSQTLLYNGRSEELFGVWRESYPMTTFPLIHPSAEELRNASAFDRARWEQFVRQFAAEQAAG
jgi:hypothetical protein